MALKILLPCICTKILDVHWFFWKRQWWRRINQNGGTICEMLIWHYFKIRFPQCTHKVLVRALWASYMYMMPSIFHKWYPRFGLFCVTIVFCIIFHCRSIVSVVLFQKLIKILVYFKTLNVSVWFYAIQHISRNCVDLMHQLDTLKKLIVVLYLRWSVIRHQFLSDCFLIGK